MGILLISITAGIAILAIFLIVYFRRDKTIKKNLESHDVVKEKTGKDAGVYD